MRRIIIHRSDPNEVVPYWVECPSLGIASMGESIDDAIRMIHEAIELHLEDLAANGDPIPPEDVDVEPVEQLLVLVGEVPPNVNSIALQGVVSGSNFPAVLTNDPATAAALDPTISLLDPLRSVTQLPATGESPDWRNWAIAGALVSAVVIGAAFKKYLRRSA